MNIYNIYYVMLAAWFIFFPKISQNNVKDWQLIKEKGEIKVWYRVKSDGHREYKAEMVTKVSVKEIVDLIQNDELGTKWINRAVAFKTIDQEADSSWYTYTEIEIPWPFDNKDLVSYNRVFYQSPDSAFIKMDAVPNHIPEEKNKARIVHMDASWAAKSLDEQSSVLTYTVASHAYGLPPWIAQPIVAHGLYTTLHDMDKVLQE
ncbi:hypothetical protein V6R21_18085 [Limibacter armeniacum]|uniref:hypothetical protein n=1 Tax=Limibacter armeniacum TaxID=466084 RepID=UPI002FE6991B